MSLASDLLDQASTLASLDPMKPNQASLRRAISAAYYSIFHLLIDEAARRISTNTALQPYIARSFEHKNLKEAATRSSLSLHLNHHGHGSYYLLPLSLNLFASVMLS